MKANDEKILMSEVATLYYEKKHTQQEIADFMNLTRQTVSRLLNDAIKENIVEIKIHNPQKDCEELENQICQRFGLRNCVVCRVSSKNETVRSLMTVRAAVDYIVPILDQKGLKIGISWGRTIQEFIRNLPEMNTGNNIVFPLFGATDNENSYFSSNELAREMADRIGANVKYAWFPYQTDNKEDCVLIRELSYYKKMESLWNTADVAIVGIGNTEVMEVFGQTFGCSGRSSQVVGDIATHFFDESGHFVQLYENSLCASADSIRKAAHTIAIACGNKKAKAMVCAMWTGLLDTLITDEYTAKAVLEHS